MYPRKRFITFLILLPVLGWNAAAAEASGEAASIVAALWEPGRELQITPDLEKVKAAGITVEAIRQACAGRRLRHNVYNVRVGGRWIHLAKIAAVREREFDCRPFRVTLTDGREARITAQLDRVGPYCISSADFQEIVRKALINPRVEDPGDAHVMDMIRVDGSVIPHLTTRDLREHFSMAVPLREVAAVEIRGKPGPQAEVLRRLRAVTRLQNESWNVYLGWTRQEFEAVFGQGKSMDFPGEEASHPTRSYSIGERPVWVFFHEDDSVRRVVPVSLDDEPPEIEKAEVLQRTLLFAFLTAAYKHTGKNGRAELQQLFKETPDVGWSDAERQRLVDVADRQAAEPSRPWKTRVQIPSAAAKKLESEPQSEMDSEPEDRDDSDFPDADKEIARIEDLAAMRELELSDLTDVGLADLAKAVQLRTLRLSYCDRITDAGVANLKGLTQLETLDLEGKAITDAGVAHLSGLTNLRVLKIGQTSVTGKGMSHLAGLKQLEFLQVSPASADDSALVTLKGLKALKVFDGSGMELYEEDGAETGGQAPSGTIVNLRHAPITDAGLAHLAGMAHLRRLWLSESDITDVGLVHLAGLVGLEELRLDGTRVTGAGLRHLTRLTNLREVHLDGLQIGGTGLQHLASLANMHTLYLCDTDVEDADLKSLKGLDNLRRLWLSRTNITKTGVSALADLKTLDVYSDDTPATDEPLDAAGQ